MKILITIGSMVEKKFTRLFKIIDELCEEGILEGKDIIAQVGNDGYKSKNFKGFEMISDGEFKEIIKNSDLIITHAGTGTVSACLKSNKKVIIFPRLYKYDEHYDNHQLELADMFVKNKYVLCATNKEELIKCINKIDIFSPAKFISNNKSINNIIINYIEED